MLPLKVRHLGRAEYVSVWDRMQAFTEARAAGTPDELWFVEHPAVYTLGRNGRREHLLDAGTVPVVTADRGGQVTYHGPGQVVAYALLDLRRQRQGVRWLVDGLERSVIALLAVYGIDGVARRDAPGVYVDGAKIASLGLRVRRGCSYHGLSLNVDLDLEPFGRIHPCGYRGLPVTRLADLGVTESPAEVAQRLKHCFCEAFGYEEEAAPMKECLT